MEICLCSWAAQATHARAQGLSVVQTGHILMLALVWEIYPGSTCKADKIERSASYVLSSNNRLRLRIELMFVVFKFHVHLHPLEALLVAGVYLRNLNAIALHFGNDLAGI
jgi:hypothetical protein